MAETADQLRERVTGYIRHNVAKGDDAILALVQQGHEQVLASIDGLSDEQATFKPSADDWSVLETMQHIVAGKEGTARVCATLARGGRPGDIGGEGQDVNKEGEERRGKFASIAEARDAAIAAHDSLVEFVNTLSADTNMDATFPHALFGELNCREWCAFQRVHDGDHGGQIEQIKAAAGFSA